MERRCVVIRKKVLRGDGAENELFLTSPTPSEHMAYRRAGGEADPPFRIDREFMEEWRMSTF